MKWKCTHWLVMLVILILLLPAPTQIKRRATLTSESNTRGTSAGNLMMRNPAAVYCLDIMGYEYKVVDGVNGGQTGVCILPNGEECNQWDFYAGTCGQSYSYCTQQGYRIETRSDGRDPFAADYAVCVSLNGQVVGSITQLSDLSARATCCGSEECPAIEIIQDEPGMRETPPSEGDGVVSPSAPSSFDWRNYQGHNWLTNVKNQGGCGSCWAFAAVGVTEAHHNIIFSNPGLDLNLAEQDLVSCSDAGSCNGGSSGMALLYMRDSGIVDEACFPYMASDSSCNRCSGWRNRRTYIDEYTDFMPDRSSIRQSVADYGPIYVYMGIGSKYGGYFDGSGTYRCSDDSGVNHAVVIVGYNNSSSYWIVRNSWGDTWGRDGNGYFKVGYGECSIDSTYAGYAYVAPPVTSHSLAGTMGSDDWYLSDVVITLTANEAVRWTKYHIDGGGWKTYGTAFTIKNDGIHTLEYYSKDTFGGEENIKSTTVKIDKTAPDNPTTVNAGCSAVDNVWQRDCIDPDFTWSGADDHGGSGVKDYHVYWGDNPNGAPTIWRSTASYDPDAIDTLGGVVTYYLRMSTRDNLGYESDPETVFTLRYDGSAPIADPLVAGGVETVHSLQVNIEPRAQDTGSGLNTTRLSNDGITWHSEPYTASTTWVLEPLSRRFQTVYLEVEDIAGNRSSRYPCWVCLNLYPPHPSSEGYQLWSAGSIVAGNQASSSNYRLSDTAGQSVMGGDLRSVNYRLRSGFQALWPANPSSEMFTPFSCWHRIYLPVTLRGY